MRILWHSCAPWEPTGYGGQTAIWTRELARLGHDVAISAYHGVAGREMEWEGLRVFPAPLGAGANALMGAHYRAHKTDLLIMLADLWTYGPGTFKGMRAAAWTPVDTDPLSVLDAAVLARSAVTPIAMSQAGRAALEEATAKHVACVPHGIDTTQDFRPLPARDKVRAAFGVDGLFVVGVNANNIDPVRKALPEQLLAFARFHGKHPQSVLLLHTMARMAGSLDLPALTARLGIARAVRFADQDRMQAGTFDVGHMRAWYNACDVVLNATYGEGFGLPAVEAQACGTPVIVSRGTSGPELVGPGWLVDTEPWWNPTHRAWWHRPSVAGLERALEEARRDAAARRARAREFALAYDIAKIAPAWPGVLEGLCA